MIQAWVQPSCSDSRKPIPIARKHARGTITRNLIDVIRTSSVHGLGGELLDLRDRPGGLPLEGDPVEALVEVNRVVTSHHLRGA